MASPPSEIKVGRLARYCSSVGLRRGQSKPRGGLLVFSEKVDTSVRMRTGNVEEGAGERMIFKTGGRSREEEEEEEEEKIERTGSKKKRPKPL